MNLELQNIGIIKQANITFNGLTVIAGENDTGKSTVGKILYSIVKSISKNGKISELNLQSNFNKYFKNKISEDGQITLEANQKKLCIKCLKNKCSVAQSTLESCFMITNNQSQDIIMIETPLIWNLMELFTQLPMIEDAMDIHLEYPKIMKDLHWNLTFQNKKEGIDISKNIKDIIQGEFLKSDIGNFIFQKKNKTIDMVNTATGIKYFGVLQVLSDKNHLYDGQILILDEPEVHLHPKWQLELAKVIVSLVKNGIKVLVNSHSPYMIEALQKYAEFENLNDRCDFYIAQNEVVEKIDNSNAQTLSEIFEKLSQPFDEFEKLESQRLQNG